MFLRKPTPLFSRQTRPSQQDAATFRLERVGRIELPTKPWEGLVLPLNYTRRRFAVYAVLAMLASAVLVITPARAQDTSVAPAAPVTSVQYHFTDETAKDGWTLKTDSGAELGVFRGVLPGAADVSWSVSSDVAPTLPDNTSELGSLYRMSISGVMTLNTESKRIGLALPDAPSLWQKSIWLYDTSAKVWTKLPSKLNTKTGKWQAGFAVLDAYVAVLEDRHVEQGNATWYCKTHCSSRYPKLHGTSNDFSVGSFVTVTNLANNAAVTVKIVSGWGQPAGRIIDLSWPAYAALKPSNKGVTWVTVSPKGAVTEPAAVTPPTSPDTTTTETIPSLSVSSSGAVQAPAVTAASYQVLDAASGKVLAAKDSTTAKPIASLTKLVTAMVVLDAHPDVNKVVTYTKADATAYAYLRIKPNDTLTIKDLFYSMIVGSANNAATALSRTTGLTNPQFLAAMNAKVATWGLASTTFTDVSGLDPLNTSSAADMAVIASHAFHDYPLLRQASTVSAYTFFTRNTKISHTIKTTDKLLGAKNGLTITGGKTGFLDEAKYTYVLRVKNTKGAQVVVSLLGSSTSTTRFNEAASLATWALANYSWS